MQRHKNNAFTLVELLVVITIIGMLVALVLPAVNSAREQARQVQCTNNQRSYGQAIQQFEAAKGYFPGYRQLLQLQSSTPSSAIVSWQIALLPNMGKADVYQSMQSGVTGFSTNAPLPYLEFAVCPSDNSIAGRSSPWTSYVANCGRLDKWVPNIGPCVAEITSNPPIPETSANGIFNDKVLGTLSPGLNNLKVSMTDIKDGASTTLMLAENVDVYYYSDNLQAIPQNNLNSLPNLVKNYPNCTERGAGFLWWDTSTNSTATPALAPAQNTPPSGFPQAGLNIQRGDWDPAGPKGWPADFNNPGDQANYAARPASNHPGIVIVVFAGGNTKNLREDIDYPVYCLLMTPNGANSPTRSHDTTNKSWQKYFPLDEGKL